MNMASRTCSQCGTPLAPNEQYCHDCGAGFVEPSMTDPTRRSNNWQANQPSLDPTQYAGPPLSQLTPSPYYRDAQASTAYGSQNQGYTPPPPPRPAEYPLPYPQGPEVYEQQPFPPYTPGPQYPKKKRIPRAWLVLGSILVLLLACSGLLFASSRRTNNNTGNITTTSTTVTTTRAVTPTARPIFTDDFVDNSKNWDVGSAAGYSSTISNNVLTMKEANHKLFRESIPTNTSYTDFSITMTFTLVQGDLNDSVGLFLRSSADGHQGYYVDIYGDDTYDIIKIQTDTHQKNQAIYLAEPTTSPALHTKGQKNIMTVVMKGSQIALLLNNKVVKSVTDSSFIGGPVALFIENGNSSDGVIATFDSVAIYPPPDQMPH